jgi:hypothetical protein
MLLFVWDLYIWHLLVAICCWHCLLSQLRTRTAALQHKVTNDSHQIKYCTSVWCVCVLLLMTVVTPVTDRLMQCICMFCGLAASLSVCIQNSTTEGKHNGGSVI